MKLLKMGALDEYHFYILDGAILQLFGDESYRLFCNVVRHNKMVFISWAESYQFAEYAMTEEGMAPETPEDIESIMMQLCYIRRCVYSQLLKALRSLYTEEFFVQATNEVDESSVPYRDAIAKSVGVTMIELSDDPDFRRYIDYDVDETQIDVLVELEQKSLHRMFKVCAIHAKKRNIELRLSGASPPSHVRRHLVQQFKKRKKVFKECLQFLHAGGNTGGIGRATATDD